MGDANAADTILLRWSFLLGKAIDPQRFKIRLESAHRLRQVGMDEGAVNSGGFGNSDDSKR